MNRINLTLGKLGKAISLTSEEYLKSLKKNTKKKCDKGHKLKVVGHSCCDDIVECKCGKWYRCGIGGFWPYYEKNI